MRLTISSSAVVASVFVQRHYDDLTEQYRDIALAGQTGISLDAGIGVTDDGDPAALLGIGYKKLRLWGTADEDRNAVFIGGSFPF